MTKYLKQFGLGLIGGTCAIGINHLIQDEPITTTIIEKTVEVPSARFASNYTNQQVLPEEINFNFAAEATLNSVVHIKTEYESKSYSGDPLFDYFWGPGRGRGPLKASGSGVILTEDGYIVTNNHVIDNADKVTVILNDQREYEAEVIGAYPDTDIALLKIDSKDLPVIAIGNSDDTKIGDWVLAVGNPYNLTSTVTAGIVSAKSRSINLLRADPDRDIIPIESFIQTDAAVNPGNSGGALVNAKGELVGINTAIASRTGSYAGYSFAVPVNIMKKVTEDLMKYGSVQRAFIGVTITDVDQKLADEKEFKEIKGVYVSGVTAKGAADEAGLTEGDVILKIGSTNVNNVPELQEQIGNFRPGDVITILVRRGDKEEVKSLTLQNKDGNTDIITEDRSEVKLALGGKLEEASDKEKKLLKIKFGVKITDLTTGKLRLSGVKEDFIILKIDKVEIHTPAQLLELLKEKKKGGVLIEGIYPSGVKGYYALSL